MKFKVMIKLPHLIVILAIFASCDDPVDLKPKHWDLEIRGLFGKVMEMQHFRANFKGSGASQIEKPILNLKEEFTEFGSVKLSEYFDTFGEPQQKSEHFYNNSNSLIKSVTTGQNPVEKSIEIISNDSINKVTTRTLTYNDSLNFKIIIEYDASNNINRQIKIQNGDTIISNYDYIYDDSKNLLKMVELKVGEEEGVIDEYKYDENGNIIERVSASKYYKFKTIKEYSNNILTKSRYYTTSPDLKEQLNEIIEFDKYSNATTKKIFEDGKLNKELKNIYRFDGKGNWIEKKVSSKEYFANANKFIPIYVESRKIRYWE
jgi:hypothetical protein